MTIDQLVSYAKLSTSQTPKIPTWYQEEGLPYPNHPRLKTLISQYEEAWLKHIEWNRILQTAILAKINDPGNQQKAEEAGRCQEDEERLKATLEQAIKLLKDFINHTPQERTTFLEAEITEWEAQLQAAQTAKQDYTQQLLNDPEIQRKRLERQINGYEASEYTNEQLARLRSLRGDVQRLEDKVIERQHDIERVHKLVTELERKEQIQAAMDEVVPKFNQASSRLQETWKQLSAIAAEYKIQVPVYPEMPEQAVYQNSQLRIIKSKR